MNAPSTCGEAREFFERYGDAAPTPAGHVGSLARADILEYFPSDMPLPQGLIEGFDWGTMATVVAEFEKESRFNVQR